MSLGNTVDLGKRELLACCNDNTLGLFWL